MDEEFEPRIASLFNHNASCNVGIKNELNLGEVIPIDSQLMVDIFYNRALLEKIAKSKTKMRLKSNGGTMRVSHQATVNGYHNSVWFIEILSPIS